jgi:hypothetical protein
MTEMRVKPWLVVSVALPVAAVFFCSEQLQYLRFRFVEQNTASLPGADIRFVGDWLPATDNEPGQVTASRFDAWGFQKPTHFITVQRVDFDLSEEVAGRLPSKTYPWGEAKIVATKEARELVGLEGDADITALIPELNLLVVLSHLADLDAIEVRAPERVGRVWG